MSESFQQQIKELEKRVSALEKMLKVNKLEKSLKVTFYEKGLNYDKKTFIYDSYDQEKIKKDLKVKYVFNCFTKENADLHCAYYIDGITNTKQLVISDNYEKLINDIIEIGRCE